MLGEKMLTALLWDQSCRRSNPPHTSICVSLSLPSPLRQPLTLSSSSPAAAPPTPPSLQPLQHQAETNIPVEIPSYNKLTFTLKSHQLPISLRTSPSFSLHVLHGSFVLFWRFGTSTPLLHILKLCSVCYTFRIYWCKQIFYTPCCWL